ncbi:MAG: hypothetical protein Q8P05_00435 [Candidatus Diapherotrites archaeon]|nr:hypothetical protein [Candidatus Diapherotrites archaeon]
MASLSIYFFGKPEWEFGDKIDAAMVKAKGDELRERLHTIADAMEKLTAAGWEPSMALYDVYFSKDIPRKQAEMELKELGIDEGTYHLDEFDEDEDEEE